MTNQWNQLLVKIRPKSAWFRVFSYQCKSAFKSVKIRVAHSLLLQISLSILLLFGSIALILTLRGGKPALASWFDDSWAYRNAIPISSHTAAETNVYISATLDTSTSGQFQSDCGDLRFTTVGGDLLPYFIVSGCATATTVVHVFFDSFPAGAQTIYYYYGNPQAANGFSSSDFSPEAANYAIGTVAAQEKTTGPVAYWKFDDGTGTNAQDSTVNNNDGTITGATWQTEDQCVSNKCLFYDGTTAYTTAADSNSLKMGTSDLSISAFIRMPTATATHPIVVKRDSSVVTNPGYQIQVQSDGLVYVYFSDGSATRLSGSGTGRVDDNKWHHILVSFTRTSNALIYIDGKRVGSFSISTQQGNASETNSLDIGKELTTYFKGFIDDVKIYNYAKTAAQIKADFAARGTSKGSSSSISISNLKSLSDGLVGYWKMDEASWTNDCTATSVTDSSGNGNNGKSCPASSGPTGGAVGKFGNGGSFDGSDDQVTATDPSSGVLDFGTGSFSYGLWVNFTSGGDVSGNWQVPLNKGGGDASTTGYDLEFNELNNILYGEISDGTTIKQTTYSSNLRDSTWHHIFVVVDRTSNTITLYTDATQRGQTSIGGLGSVSNNINLNLGGFSTYFFLGKIDDVRIYNRALSPREVRDLYNWAPGPVGYWNFEEGSGNANDISGNGNTATNTGTVLYTNGKYGKAGNFDGSAKYFSAGDPASGVLDFGTGDFTISTWFQRNSNATTNLRLIAKGGDSDAQAGWGIDGANNSIIMRISDGTPRVNKQITGLSTSTWYHAVFVKTSTQIKAYLNGVEFGSATSHALGSVSNSTSFTIGALYAPSLYWDGKIDDVKVYNYARTQKQIVEDMLGSPKAVSAGGGNASAVGHWKFDEGYGTTANNSGNGGSALNGTLTPGSGGTNTTAAAMWDNSGKYGKAVEFDGTDDYISIAGATSLNITGSLTLSTWVNPSTLVQASGPEIIAKSGNAYFYRMRFLNGGKVRFNAYGTSDTTLDSTATLAASTWNHVVMVYDGQNKKIYLNGKLDSSEATTGDMASEAATSLYIGSLQGTSEFFAGSIDEPKVYSYALTSDEVKTDYNQGSSMVLGSVSTESDATSASNAAARGYCIPGDASACSAPVGEWNFEEGTSTVTNDTSGNANTGTLTLGPTWTTGKIGKAVNLDGINDVVSVVDSDSLDITGSITVEAWYYVSAAEEGSLVSHTAGNGLNGWTLDSRDVSGCRVYLYIENNGAFQTCTAGRWNHVTGVYNGSTITVYVNGIPGTAVSYALGSTAVTTRTGIGARDNNGTFNYFFTGKIDNVRVFNYTRTPAQIAWDYNRGAPVGHWKFDECQGTVANDSSAPPAGGGNSGTITIGATGTNTSAGTCTGSAGEAWKDGVTGKFNSSLEFDGTDDYVQITDTANLRFDASTADFSLFAWVKRTTTGTEYIISKEDADNDGWRLMFNSGNQVVCSEDATDVTSTSTITDTNWHLVGCTIDRDGNGQTYIDGRADGAAVAMGTDAMATTSNIRLATRSYTSTNYLNGQIDDVQIFNYALTATQIKTLYNQSSGIRFGPSTGSP